MNELPEGWTLVKTSEIGRLLRGVNYKKEDASNEPREGYLPVLRGNNIQEELSLIDLVFVHPKNISAEQKIQAGDIVFAMSSGSKHLVGKSAKAKSDFNGSFGAFCGVFRANDKVNKNFAAYFFKGPYYKKTISEISKGTNINNLKREHILDLDFPLPPLPVQYAIVTKLEEIFSELDHGVEQLKTARQQLRVYRQAVLKWAFEGRLTNEGVVDGELPEGWKWVKLGEVADMCLGKMLDKQKNIGSLKPYLGNINVRWGKFNLDDLPQMRFEEKENERYNLKKGDLVICEGGEPGRAAIWKEQVPEMKIQKALHRVRFDKNTSAEYFYYYLQLIAQAKKLDQYFTGTTIKHLTGQSLKKIELPLPPLSEQHLIVSEIERRLSVCDKLEETIEGSLKAAEVLRAGVLKRAFEGKLV